MALGLNLQISNCIISVYFVWKFWTKTVKIHIRNTDMCTFICALCENSNLTGHEISRQNLMGRQIQAWAAYSQDKSLFKMAMYDLDSVLFQSLQVKGTQLSKIFNQNYSYVSVPTLYIPNFIWICASITEIMNRNWIMRLKCNSVCPCHFRVHKKNTETKLYCIMPFENHQRITAKKQPLISKISSLLQATEVNKPSIYVWK